MWRSLTQYNPQIGYTFIPGLKARVPHEGGGYLIRVNESGFRCDHDFAPERPSGQFRVLLFGDSQTAGDGVSNGERYGDQLEKKVSNLQVYNFGLSGTGTDQQHLIYQEFAKGIAHDVVILGVHVENINRVASRYRPYIDEKGETVIYAKPYYRLEQGKLALHHVPVLKEPIPQAALHSDESQHVDWGLPFFRLRKIAKKFTTLRRIAQRVVRLRPVPEYEKRDNPRWLLMQTILTEWIHSIRSPVVLVPIPLYSFFTGQSDPSHYQARFREVAEKTKCIFHDPLPAFQRYPLHERQQFYFEKDLHFTPVGHAVLAESLVPVIKSCLGIA